MGTHGCIVIQDPQHQHRLFLDNARIVFIIVLPNHRRPVGDTTDFYEFHQVGFYRYPGAHCERQSGLCGVPYQFEKRMGLQETCGSMVNKGCTLLHAEVEPFYQVTPQKEIARRSGTVLPGRPPKRKDNFFLGIRLAPEEDYILHAGRHDRFLNVDQKSRVLNSSHLILVRKPISLSVD